MGTSEFVRDLAKIIGCDVETAKLALAFMDKRMEDGPCYYCGEPTNSYAGNPSQWPVYLCHRDEPGKVKPHHSGCVSKRLYVHDVHLNAGEKID